MACCGSGVGRVTGRCEGAGSCFPTLATEERRKDGAPAFLAVSAAAWPTISPWSMRKWPDWRRSGEALGLLDLLGWLGTVQMALISTGAAALAGSAKLLAKRRCFSI